MGEPLTYGSLFAGIGGFDLGFDRAGLACKWQVELDTYARRVLAKHWPDVRRHDDVRTWPQPDAEWVDVVCGGFPCQDISLAGKGAGLAGSRSGLFFEFVRIIRDMEPRVVVMENVAALLNRGFETVLGSLASLGFDAEWCCIPAAGVGAPHVRDRVFLVAYPHGNLGHKRVFDRERWECGGRPVSVEGYREYAEAHGWTMAAAIEASRVADGVSPELDRHRGAGNAVMPQIAEFIGQQIVSYLG